MASAAVRSLVLPITQQTVAQRPFIFWIGGLDFMSLVDVSSWRLDDPGGQPAKLSCSIRDVAGTYKSFFTVGMLAQWRQTTPTDTMLFQGYLMAWRPQLLTVWADIDLEFTDLSSQLDTTMQVVGPRGIRPAGETDAARIGALLAEVPIYANSPSIAVTNGAMGAQTMDRTSPRAALEAALGAATTNADYVVDQLGRITTFTASPGTSAPFDINNDAPNGTTTIAADLRPENDGYSHADAVYINGGSAAGSGYVWSAGPYRDPPVVAIVDAPDSMDAAARTIIGGRELAKRQLITRLTITVDGKDGWARGQEIDVTDGRLGYSARAFVIVSVSMTSVTKTSTAGFNGAFRQYQLVCGLPKPRMTVWLRRRDLGPSSIARTGGVLSRPS